MKWRVSLKKEGAPTSKGSAPRRQADRTPVSSSGVVVKPPGESRLDAARGPRSRPRDSEPPSLTPYQARLDVEMDDTAVSKVRDPSVSISIDADSMLPLPEPAKAPSSSPAPRFEPLYSIALGTVLGALIVAVVVLAVRVIVK